MVDYVGQSTTANYTLLDGDGWVGLIMSETVRPSVVGDARKMRLMEVRSNRTILPTMVVPPRWRDGISFFYSSSIRKYDRGEYR
jgi:hypothetical protein